MKKTLAMMLLCAASLCAMGQTTQRATQFLAGNGSCGTPGFAFQGGTNDGLFWDSGNARVTVCVGGVDVMDISASLATLRTVTIKGIEQAAPAGVAGSDMLYPDSTAHRWKVNDNNGGAKTLAELETAQTWSQPQTFNSGDVLLAGASSGATTLIPAAAASGTLTLPAATDNLVAQSTTDTLKNKTLNGAGSGNAVNLLNTQGPTSALVGNSADQTVYTFTIPANTIQAGKGFRIKMVGFHSTGATATTYKIIVGSTTTATTSSTSGNTANWTFSMYNVAGVQNSQYYEATAADGVSANMVNTFGNTAENFANAITVKLTFNVANTDQYTGKLWAVELIQ